MHTTTDTTHNPAPAVPRLMSLARAAAFAGIGEAAEKERRLQTLENELRAALQQTAASSAAAPQQTLNGGTLADWHNLAQDVCADQQRSAKRDAEVLTALMPLLTEDEKRSTWGADKMPELVRRAMGRIAELEAAAQAAPAAGPQLPGLPLPATRSDAHGELFDTVQMQQHAVRYAHAALAAAQAPALPGGWRCWADDRMAHLTRDGLSLTFARESHDTRERGAAEFIAAAAQARPRWRHKRTGGTYVEVMRGHLQASDDLDMAPVVVYRSEADGRVWVRPVAEFEDGRFERISGAAAPADTAAQEQQHG